MAVTPHRTWVTFDAVDGLDEVPTGTPGWWGRNYMGWIMLGPRLGEHRHIPGVDGRTPIPQEFDELTVVTPLLIIGKVDADGNPYADPIDGVWANHKYLREHLFSYTGVRDVTLHAPDGTLWTGEATVQDWFCTEAPNSDGTQLVGDLEVKVHGGYLVEAP